MGEEKKLDNRMTGLVDVDMLQRFQDGFCAASGMYMQCVGTAEGQITRPYGSEEAMAYINGILPENFKEYLIKLATDNKVENVVEGDTMLPYLRMCAVSTRVEGKTQIIWMIAAFLKEQLPEGFELPSCVMAITEKRYMKSIEFLEVQSRMLFAVKMEELIAQETMLRSIESEEHIKEQLHRSETMAKIVTLLEADGDFNKLVDEILALVCDCLSISGGALLQENEDGTVDMICEYEQRPEWCRRSEFQNVPKEKVPFFNGKPYVISADSMVPESFVRYFTPFGVTAGMYQPIDDGEKTAMYLCFHVVGEHRIWEMEDIKFINDVKWIVQSIRSKRTAKDSLASSYHSLEAILENVGCGICVLDEESRTVLYTNQRFKDLLKNATKVGRLQEVLAKEDGITQKERLQEVYVEAEDRWLDVSKSRIDWVDGRQVALYTLYDITEKKLNQQKIETQANNDFLTGLFNRMRCEQDLKKSIEEAEERGGEGALLFIDLDDFKHINDGLGHQYGDVLLKAISHSLQEIRGVESSCYRVGGDEFVVIVHDTAKSNLERICMQVSSIFEKPWFLKGEDYFCTMSMGVVCYPTDGKQVDDLIQKADIALYEAKRRGKNRIEYYSSKDTNSYSYRRLDMEKNMRKATLDECREFEVYYQPVVDVQNGGKVCGAEALLRWNSAEMGFISPVDFIPLAEYLGLINPIGDYVLLQAAKRCRYWNDMGHPDYKVNVNLSVVQLLQSDIVKRIKKVLDETRINPGNLTLEVTESLAVNDMERMRKVLLQIKELGVKVALDDFGTGYSSLNHIREMPIDVIKIDRCFIEHVGEDDFSDAFVKMVAELAATLGVQVCTEGVENARQSDIIRDMRVPYIQGYYYGKPMKIEEFEEKYL